MSTYRVEWPCGDVTETDSWEPSECPICRLAEVEAERDTLRRLCLEAADMLDEPTATGGDAMDAMAARLRAAGGER